MRKILYIFLASGVVLSCTPRHPHFSSTASYQYIQKEKDDSTINAIILPYKEKVDADMNKVIGYSEVAMPKLRDQPETLLGNFVADCAFETAQSLDKEVDFCVLNNGGLRSSLPMGDITIRNVYELMPFDNEIVVVSME